jgi:hypothetical protein
MAKITAYIPEPTDNYDVNNQRQILEAVNTIKNQLNFGYQQDLINEQAAMLQFMYGNQSGVFNPAYASAGNIPYLLAVAEGLIPDVSSVNIFAASDNVKTGDPKTLWELLGTSDYAFPATAQTMNVKSSSASDNSTARVLISGLDTNWNALTETVALNGTADVDTVGSFLRINSVIMTAAGSGQTSNVGNITVKNQSNTTVYAQIDATKGRTFMSLYSVPVGYTFYVNTINQYSGDGNGGSAYINYVAKSTNNFPANPVTITALTTTWGGSYDVTRSNPFPYTQKSDVQWQFSTNTGTHSVGLILQGILVKN